jgi:hypothetical protein
VQLTASRASRTCVARNALSPPDQDGSEADDVGAFASDHDATADVRTVALTLDQIDAFDLIRQDVEPKSRQRYHDLGWPYDFTVQLEAMSPVDLAAALHNEIEAQTDAVTRHAMTDREESERDELRARL